MNLLHSRRAFFANTFAAASVMALAPSLHAADEKPKARMKLGISSYSYWHFRAPKVSIETVIEKAGVLGVSGVDILHRQMDLPEREPLTPEHRVYLRRLRRHALTNGVGLICLSIHQNFVS